MTEDRLLQAAANMWASGLSWCYGYWCVLAKTQICTQQEWQYKFFYTIKIWIKSRDGSALHRFTTWRRGQTQQGSEEEFNHPKIWFPTILLDGKYISLHHATASPCVLAKFDPIGAAEQRHRRAVSTVSQLIGQSLAAWRVSADQQSQRLFKLNLQSFELSQRAFRSPWAWPCRRPRSSRCWGWTCLRWSNAR